MGVAWNEGPAIAQDFAADTGLREPILMDKSGLDPQCPLNSVFGDSLYLYLEERIYRPPLAAPFPLQLLLDADRTIRWFTVNHNVPDLSEVLTELLGPPGP